MKKAKIKISTVDKIFKFLEKEKGEDIPINLKYLSREIKLVIAKENLSVTKFNNGEPIPEAKTEEEWVELGNEKSPAFMRNGNDFHYNHFAVTDERGICPTGWRVPTAEDLRYIKYRRLYKTFPLTGFRSSIGVISYVGTYGDYWSSTVDGSSAGFLSFYSSNAYVNSTNRAFGFSVRCVRDKK